MDAKLEVTNLITPLINSYKILSNEWKNLFEIGVSEYLQTQTEKYYLTNTFIHRADKVRFYDIYYPIKATYKALTTDFKKLDDIFGDYGKITIVGSAGSGKTTLIKHIFLHTIKTTKKIPILIELRNLNDFNGDFEKLVCEKVVKAKLKPTDDIFRRSLESGNFLFLLDGYDEIFSNKKQEINRQIETFIDTYSNNHFLITTRPGSGIEGFPRFYDFKVCDLNNEDVNGFTVKIVDDEERSDRIIKIVRDPRNNNYIEYLRNPLLLSMFIMAFENHPEIPKKKSSFYRNVFDTLYSRHDGVTKGSWPREKLTKLERDDFEKILNIFSYLSLTDGQYTFTEEYLTDILKKVKKVTDYKFRIEELIYDLRTTISIMVLDGFEYHFPHRSLQEYFTAQFISDLPSEKKAKAYDNLFKILEASSTDHSFNLWSICNELDFIDFTINFILPKLKTYESFLSKESDEKTLESYIKLCEAELFLRNDTKREIGIVRHFNFYNAIIDFCGVYDFKPFFEFPKNSGANVELLELNKESFSENDRFHGRLKGIKSAAIKKVLLKYHIIEIIEEYKKAISEKIRSLEMEIEKRKVNMDNILNI